MLAMIKKQAVMTGAQAAQSPKVSAGYVTIFLATDQGRPTLRSQSPRLYS